MYPPPDSTGRLVKMTLDSTMQRFNESGASLPHLIALFCLNRIYIQRQKG